MTLYIADRIINEIMKVVGMKEEHKEFIVPMAASFHKEPSDAYFLNILERGKTLDKRFWIVAVKFEDRYYCQKGIKCLSDGKNETWITNELRNS